MPCRFCGGADGDGHLFWDCTFLPLVEIREHPEFHGPTEMDKSHWPKCLLWHGWLPVLSGVNGGSPQAENPAEGAGNLLECALGSYTSGLLVELLLPVVFDAEEATGRVPDKPDVWNDGSLVQDKVSGTGSSGSVFFSHLPRHLWAHRRWGHLDDDIGGDRAIRSCRGHCSVPGPLQTLQRAESWEVILALQAADGVHLGVDNLSVVRHVGRLLDDNVGSRPAELVKDGDLIFLFGWVLEVRGQDTVRVSEDK